MEQQETTKDAIGDLSGEEINQRMGWDKDTSSFDKVDQASDSISDHAGNDCYRYDFDDCSVFWHLQDNYWSTEERGMRWRDYLYQWDWTTWNGDFNEMLAAFGLDPELDEASIDYDGECKVWIEYCYYQGTNNAPVDGWITSTVDAEPRIFVSYDAAQTWINQEEKGTYYLSHGEAGRPTYTICKA